MSKKILLVIMGIFMSLVSFGQDFQFLPDVQTQRVNSSYIAGLPSPTYNDQLTLTQDPLYSSLTSSLPSTLHFKSVMDYVMVGVNRDTPVITAAYKYRISFQVDGYNYPGGPATSKTFSLDFSYDPDSLKPYIDASVYRFAGFHAIRATVTNIQDISGSPTTVSRAALARNFFIETGVSMQRYDDVTFTINATSSVVDNKLHVVWGTGSGGSCGSLPTKLNDIQPVEFELEWTYIDDYVYSLSSGVSHAFDGSGPISYNFKKNCTRVRLKNNSYDIPLLYERGAIVFRIRAIRPDYSQSYKDVIYNAWTLPDAGSVNKTDVCKVYVIPAAHQNDDLNWQYTINFAEDGKYKHVINYFDGTLRNRQTQTKINTDDNYIIAVDKVYDYEGHASIQTLPTPLQQKYLGYRTDIALNMATNHPYVPADFDITSCSSPDSLPPLSTSSQARIYYSSSNPVKTGFQKFVPDAKGYPFMQSIYSPDNLLLHQGGVGYDNQLWTDHGTRHEYMRAMQAELNTLFGSEAGIAQYFPKQVTTDPNKQTSFTIFNLAGQTVATGLVGLPDTTSSPIDPIYGDDTSTFCFDAFSGFTQDKLSNGLSLNNTFYVERTANHSLEYHVTIPPFNAGCGKYILAKGTYKYSATNDCGIPKIPVNTGTLGYDSVATSPVSTNYRSGAPAYSLTKGKYMYDKLLTFNPYEINNRVYNFVKSNEPGCFHDEKWFVHQSVNNGQFPCVDSGSISPCDARKRQMIKELWPNAKYGYYYKNSDGSFHMDTSYCDGVRYISYPRDLHPQHINHNSIFTNIATASGFFCDSGTSNQHWVPTGSTLRYQDGCVTLPSSVTKNGKVYTSIASLPVDTFIYIFNDTIAEALLPLHPEFCKLSLCDDGTFVTKLEGFSTQQQAVQGNMFVLDSIINHDPLYANASTMDKPGIHDKLAYFKNFGNQKLDRLAITQAYANAGDGEEAQHNAKFLYNTEITGFTFTDSSVKEKYFEVLKGYYLANRSYIQQRILDSVSNSCAPCASLRMALVTPSVFPSVFSANSTALDASLPIPSWMRTVINNVNDPSYDKSTITQPIELTDSVNAFNDSSINYEVDNIIRDLGNCSLSADTLDSIKSKLVQFINQGFTLNPSLIMGAIGAANVALTDLCNTFLASHNLLNTSDQVETTYDCARPEVYDDIKDFLNRDSVITALSTASWTGGGVHSFYLSSANKFETSIASKLSIGASDLVKVEGYLDSIKSTGTAYIKYVKLKVSNISGAHTDFYFKRKLSTSPYIDGSTGLGVTSVSCLNDDAGATNDGLAAKFTAVVDFFVGGNYRYYMWGKDIAIMTDPIGKLPLPCITCITIKNAMKDFKKEQWMYGYDTATNHPLYDKVITNYLNFKLNKNYAYSDYLDLMKGCAITDSVYLPRHYATVKISCSADANVNSFISGLNGFTLRNLIDTRVKYTTGNSVLGIDLNLAPVDSLLYYKNHVISIAASASCSSSYLPIEAVHVFAKTGCTPSPALSTYGVFSGVSDTFYVGNTIKQPGTDYTYTGSYAAAINRANMIANLNTSINACSNSFVLADAQVYRSDNYNTTESQNYLAYIYAQDGKSVYDVRDSIGVDNLKHRISSFSGKELHYDDPFCSNGMRDLYVYTGTQSSHSGFTMLNSILTGVKTTLGSTRLFLSDGTLSQNGSGTYANLRIFRKASGVHWYQYFDGSDNMYNVYLQPPVNAPFNLNTLLLDSIQVGPGTDSVYRFTAFMHYNGVTGQVVCKGYTGFPIGYGKRVPNVVLYEKPGINFCLDSVDCEYNLLHDAVYAGKVRHQQFFDSTVSDLSRRMLTFLVDSTKDSLYLCSANQKNMITLYYYDLNGNLRKTVPPAGVDKSGAAAHTKITKYEYDSRNLVTKQITPDDGTTRFFYDGAGKLVFSQNDKQKAQGKYSYTLYDEQERPTETGEVVLTTAPTVTDPVYVTKSYYADLYPMDSLIKYVRTQTRYDVVRTTYDVMKTDIGAISGEHLSTQENLLNRVSTVSYYLSKAPDYTPVTEPSAQFETYYSYDAVGNVKTVSYNCPAMLSAKQQYKRVDYDYDQISGKVNMISYNRNRPDQFYQKYEYDADNRITTAMTSNDGVVWNRDAKYSYYTHGPLANTLLGGPLTDGKLGSQLVQSINYAYTIQGWLKSINGDVLRTDKQMMPDGSTGTFTYPRDAMAYSIDYYKGDYTAIDNTATVTNLGLMPKSLYNGNITRTVSAIRGLDNMRAGYRYDQAQRITKAAYESINEGTLTATPSGIYQNSYKYDDDGNLQNLVRYNGAASVSRIDSIIYNYTSGTNRLNYADDKQNTSTGADFKQGETSGNYQYDAIGNMVKDNRAHLKMEWNLYGKLRSVQDTTLTPTQKLYYDYDGHGNRVRKDFVTNIGSDESHKGEYYVRDASGNILAVYKFSATYSRISLVHVINDGNYHNSSFPSFINANLGGLGNFVHGVSTTAVSTIPSWVNTTVSGNPIGFYLTNDGGLYTQLLTGPTAADYMNDLQDYDMSHPGQMILGNAFDGPGPHGNELVEVISNSPMECKTMFAHLDEQMVPGVMDAFWVNVGMETPRDPVNHVMNGNNLYDHMTMTHTEGMVKAQIGMVLTNDDATEEGLHAKAFYNATLMDNAIYRSESLRMPGSPFVTTVQNTLSDNGDRAKLNNFFNVWPGSNSWLTTSAPQDHLMDIVYNANPDATLTGFLDNVPDPTVLDEIMANVPDLMVFDLYNARNSSAWTATLGPVDAISLYTFGPVADTTMLAEHDIYGSSRLGVQRYNANSYRQTFNIDPGVTTASGLSTPAVWYDGRYNDLIKKDQKTPYGNQYNGSNDSLRITRVVSNRHYEMTDHLGNVLATVLDRKTGHNPGSGTLYDYWQPDLSSAQDYYPFGMRMQERHKEVNDSIYRFGYNGKPRDDEFYGADNFEDYGFRRYNPRLARFISVDPLANKYPMLTPYQFASNNPISGIDLDGLEYATFHIYADKNSTVTKITVHKDYDLKDKNTQGPGVKYVYHHEGRDWTTHIFKSNMYGIYQGPDNPRLPKVGGYVYDQHDDYSLNPIDETDVNAKQHDMDYDKNHIVGLSGILSGKSSEANNNYSKRADKTIDKYKKGEKDDVTGKPVTKAAAKAAGFGKKWFQFAERLKVNLSQEQLNKYNDHGPK